MGSAGTEVALRDVQEDLDSSEPALAPEGKPAAAAEVPEDFYFVRFGTFMLLAQHKAPSAELLSKKLEEAIRGDSRISSSAPVFIRPGWVAGFSVYPRQQRPAESDIFSARDVRNAVHWREPVAFTVTVPIKNQPEFRGYEDIPTDTYYVSWDGITAVILWRRERGDRIPRGLAGMW
jgi:hypothetical protein